MGVAETPLKEELEAVCALADILDVATKDLEAEILRCHGDHEKAMQARATSYNILPRAEPLKCDQTVPNLLLRYLSNSLQCAGPAECQAAWWQRELSWNVQHHSRR